MFKNVRGLQRIDEWENNRERRTLSEKFIITYKTPPEIMRSGRDLVVLLIHAVIGGVINQFNVAPHVTAIALSARTGAEKCMKPTSAFVSDGRRTGMI